MKIVRNGIEIGLTEAELEQAYRERNLYYDIEDIKGCWYTRYNGELPYSNNELLIIADKVAHIMSRNDNYWESYWDNFIEAIDEFESERK